MKRLILAAAIAATALAGCSATPADPPVTAPASSSPSPTVKTPTAQESRIAESIADTKAKQAAHEAVRAAALAAAPEFVVESGPVDTDGPVRITVDATITEDEQSAIMEVLVLDFTAEGGYFVSINCSTGGTAAADHRLGNGVISVGKMGAARTGFIRDGFNIKPLAGATCP